MVKFYEMGNGNLIEVGNRGTNMKALKKLQDELWARRQGGICNVVEYTEEHAIWFARRQNKAPLSMAITE